MTTLTITGGGHHADRVEALLPARVDRILDGNAHVVEILINPRSVMRDLVRALHGHAADMLQVRQLPPADMRSIEALGRICRDPQVTAALTLTLTTLQSDALAEMLSEAGEEPNRCSSPRCPDNGEAWAVDGVLCDACRERVGA